MDIEESKGELIKYMIYLIEKKIGNLIEYDQNMANDAELHAKYMAEQDKLSKTPEEFLYSNELIGSMTISSKHIKIGLLNMLDKWFKYEENRQKVMNAKKMGMGLSLKENQGKTKIYATKRLL